MPPPHCAPRWLAAIRPRRIPRTGRLVGFFRESAARTRELAAKFDQVAGGVRRAMEERHTDIPNWRRFSL
jgi:hypothetical protein